MVFVGLLSLWGYLRMSAIWKWIDVPNERSSHSRVTLRGAGIIFIPVLVTAAILEYSILYRSVYMGIIFAGLVGLADDIRGLSARFRLLGYLASLMIGLSGLSFSLVALPWYIILLVLVVGTGVINAWNFMDGINGITILYSAFVSLSFYLAYSLNGYSFPVFSFPAIATGLFYAGLLNVRLRARAFLGDVGSVILGTIVVIWLFNLILISREPGYIIFVLIYGLDTVITIIERLIRKENIFRPHRSHLYQLLANECSWNHLSVALIYASIQTSINLLVLFNLNRGNSIGWTGVAFAILFTGFIYVIIKHKWLKRYLSHRFRQT